MVSSENSPLQQGLLERRASVFDSAIMFLTDFAYAFDLDGRFLFANQPLLTLLGLDATEIVGKNFHDLGYPPDLAERLQRQIREVCESGKVVKDETPFTNARGNFGYYEYIFSPVFSSDGTVEMIAGSTRDITEWKRMVEDLEAARREAVAASQAKDDFLAALSHELRTPLTPVLMSATAMAEDPALSKEVREELTMMQRNIGLQARLIDDLLDITRVSRGKLTIAPVITDMHLLLQQTAEILRSDELGKQLRIVFALEAERHHALVDPTRFQQVFWNVLKNALKFTPNGGTIEVQTRNDAENWISISIEDTGIGIAPTELSHVFKAFEQGEIAGQHRYGGLGLGLAISQAIVDLHGATITVSSEGIGHGAKFIVSIATVEAGTLAAALDRPGQCQNKTLRLLIVEDHEATRTVLARLLQRGGHSVKAVDCIGDALAAFQTEHFDLVISDLGLPDGSGLEMMKKIQKLRPLPAIALSGYGMEDDIQQTRDAGFSAHLVKPVDIDQLRQVLTRLTGN